MTFIGIDMERTEEIIDGFLSLSGEPLGVFIDVGIDGSLIPISSLYDFGDMDKEQAERYLKEFRRLTYALETYID